MDPRICVASTQWHLSFFNLYARRLIFDQEVTEETEKSQQTPSRILNLFTLLPLLPPVPIALAAMTQSGFLTMPSPTDSR